MAKDRIIRLVALIALCAMVWYFSFDQGRSTQKARVESMQEALEAKERVITKMAAEISRLKGVVALMGEEAANTDAESGPRISALQVTVRVDSSRTLFNGRLVLACLAIDPAKKMADLRLNLLEQDRLMNESVGLGQAIRFVVEGKIRVLVLEQIHPSQVVARIITDDQA